MHFEDRTTPALLWGRSKHEYASKAPRGVLALAAAACTAASLALFVIWPAHHGSNGGLEVAADEMASHAITRCMEHVVSEQPAAAGERVRASCAMPPPAARATTGDSARRLPSRAASATRGRATPTTKAPLAALVAPRSQS